MKIKVYTLCLTLLFTSCYSYRPIQLNSEKIKIGKKYKVKTNNSEKIKGRLMSINDTSFVLKRGKLQKTIKIANVKALRKRKFSYLKTIAIPVASLVFLVVAYSNSSELNIGEIESPR
jgi:hypothetical protein